jgi:hypothetical protein
VMYGQNTPQTGIVDLWSATNTYALPVSQGIKIGSALGNGTDDYLGMSATSGDFNGDGLGDFVISSPGNDGSTGLYGGTGGNNGFLAVILGQNTGFTRTSLLVDTFTNGNTSGTPKPTVDPGGYIIRGDVAAGGAVEGLSTSVHNAQDVNGDGIDDLVFTASLGRKVQVVLGTTAGRAEVTTHPTLPGSLASQMVTIDLTRMG